MKTAPDPQRIVIFDTTLRDGEQAPGASLTMREKLDIAKALVALNVDIIEAGFPIASPDDFEAVKTIATEVKGPRIAGLARAIEQDIRVCWDAVRVAETPRIHTFISTSEVHMKYQIKKTPAEVLADTRAMVSLARDLAGTHAGADVEFSAMDASRSEAGFLAEVLGVAGFDWILLDGEHSPNDVISFVPQLMALKDSSSAPVTIPASPR